MNRSAPTIPVMVSKALLNRCSRVLVDAAATGDRGESMLASKPLQEFRNVKSKIRVRIKEIFLYGL